MENNNQNGTKTLDIVRSATMPLMIVVIGFLIVDKLSNIEAQIKELQANDRVLLKQEVEIKELNRRITELESDNRNNRKTTTYRQPAKHEPIFYLKTI